MSHSEPISTPQPFSFTHNNALQRLAPDHSHPLPSTSPPKAFLSPDPKRIHSEKTIPELRSAADKERKVNHMLFTIEENYYSRKNQNIISPRPPKYKPATARLALISEAEQERTKERKVIFTDKLISEDQSTLTRRESISSKPIIRNSLREDNLSNSSRSLSVQNSFVSQLRTPRKERARVDNNKQKYAQILSHYQRNKEIREERSKNKLTRQVREKVVEKEEKYVDTLFPPVPASLFLNPSRVKPSPNPIRWRRLSELYTNNPVVLSKEGISQVLVTLPSHSPAGEFVAIAINAVKHSSCILQRIFQEQSFNQYGLYLVRIFQQSNWKSIILDEYIPVREEGEKIVPAFVNVYGDNSETIEVWPHLLEKAFAHYYSAYELLRFGNTVDFLTEIVGLSPLQFVFKKRSEKEFTNLQAALESVDSFAIGQFAQDKRQAVLRIRYLNESVDIVYAEPPLFKELVLTHQIFARMKRAFLYSPKVYPTLSTNTIGKYSLTHHQRSEYSIRKIVLTQNSDCIISLQQKQSRFFVKSSLDYHYMWVRVLLIQRQFNGYRWIQGKYGNSKSITLQSSLSVGEYYLIIMPEWKETQNFELTLLIWGNHHIEIEREKGSCEEMVEQACMDLAQRKGKINQLAPTLCSYNYVCPRTGLIIQNINNQKLKEDIQVHRNISGIPCAVRLLPINKDFWPEKGKMLTEINVTIPKLSSYTIVLKMRGGMDHKLIQMFGEKEPKENIK